MSIKIQTLFSEDEIKSRIGEMALEIASTKPEKLLVVAILKGSFIFAADLARAMHATGLMPEMEFMHLSSYGAQTKSSDKIRIVHDIESDVNDRDIILVDDILESGQTLHFAQKHLMDQGARSVKIAALLDKPGHRKADICSDYTGFVCPDKFVVGYGMDMGHAWRQLPFIGYVDPES